MPQSDSKQLQSACAARAASAGGSNPLQPVDEDDALPPVPLWAAPPSSARSCSSHPSGPAAPRWKDRKGHGQGSGSSCASSLADSLTQKWRDTKVPSWAPSAARSATASQVSKSTACSGNVTSSARRIYFGESSVGAWEVEAGRAASTASGATRAVSASGASRTGWALEGRASSAGAATGQARPSSQVLPSPAGVFGTAPKGPGPTAGVTPKERIRGVKLFENCPLQQSLVDQVVFGRDMDFSGDTQFDEEFIVTFNGAAGKGTWERTPETKGVKAFQVNGATTGIVPVGLDVAKSIGLKTFGNGPGHMPHFNFPVAPPPAPRSGRQFRRPQRTLKQVSPRC